MNNLQVHLERLPAMRVAHICVQGETPEGDAIEKITAWAKSKGITGNFRLFGYDNCQPYPNHIYTTWLTVGPDVEASDGVGVKDFPGGLFAVTHVTGAGNIARTWDKLVQWAQDAGHRLGRNPGLEEIISPPDVPESELRLDLFLPLAE